MKDVIIIRGRNYHPQDIELTVGRSDKALKPGGSAAFTVGPDGEERLVIVQELERTAIRSLNVEEVVRKIRESVADQHELVVDQVLLIKPGAINKTSSGKIQRRATRERYLNGGLEVITEGPIRQSETSNPAAALAVDRHSLSRWLRAVVVQRVAEVLRIDPQRVAIDKSFHSLGADSLKAVEIIDRLGEEFGIVLSSTLLFAAPTIAELVDHLAQEHLPAVVAKFPQKTVMAVGDHLPQDEIATVDEQIRRPACATLGEHIPENEIAIIGMACRFPQAPDLESYWELLRQGRNAVKEVPPDHWDWREYFDENQEAENKSYSRWGGFIDRIDQFDPGFFNISPREARLMDPQQRLFLEVAWETIEHAGYSAEKLAQADVGVFVGCSNDSYYQRIAPTLTSADHSAGIGNQKAIIANRISFHLNLRGPSIMIDTMCSSSLVAAHLACQSLRQGECSAAIVGGVNILISPEYFVGMSRIKALAPDGQCKAFDHRANGIALGEGAGAVMLKPLRRAIEDGDTIYAVIKGSAVNHGGRANGLTAPNPRAQARLVRDALKAAKVSSETITYVEAHGTGTPLGDPIEIEGLTAAFRQDTEMRRFCAIGSVKTNIGHLEPAAGVAGLIKVVLAMRHRQIPPSINFDKPNPIIPFPDTPFRVNTELSPWESEGPRRAGVSAFGMGGANAHLIVEEPPERAPAAPEIERPLSLFALSAKTEAALKKFARRHEKALAETPTHDLADICYTANLSRSSFPHRIILPARTTAQLRTALAAYASDDGAHGARQGVISGDLRDELEVAFLFTGQGSQYPNMGRRLYETQPVFRQAVEDCDRLLRPHLERSLLSVLYPGPGENSPIAETAYAQPAIFALEYALAQLWISWGIRPASALGHSVGEYAAACVAGVFSVEDALKMVADRGRLMQSLSSDGKMVAVFSSEEQVIEALNEFHDSVSIAAVNGARSVVISGSIDAVNAAVRRLERDDVATQALNVSHAFHSRMMDPILDAFEESAPRKPIINQSPCICEAHCGRMPCARLFSGWWIATKRCERLSMRENGNTFARGLRWISRSSIFQNGNGGSGTLE